MTKPKKPNLTKWDVCVHVCVSALMVPPQLWNPGHANDYTDNAQSTF